MPMRVRLTKPFSDPLHLRFAFPEAQPAASLDEGLGVRCLFERDNAAVDGLFNAGLLLRYGR